MKISELESKFYDWAKYEKNLSPNTIKDYKRALSVFKKDIGDLDVERLKLEHFFEWKKKCLERGVGEYCLAGYIFNLRSFLRFCREKGFKVINPSEIKAPKFKRKEVIFLTNEEIEKCDLICSIPSSEKFPSINLSHAVILVLYEIFKNSNKKKDKNFDKESFDSLYFNIINTLNELNFFKNVKPSIMKNFIKKILLRARLTDFEQKILSNIFKSISGIIKTKK